MSPRRVILVTGASSGIGRAAALHLLDRGHTVYGAARRLDRLRELESRGGHAIGMDLTQDATMVAGVERILAEQSRIDVLVNNAGYGVYGAVEDTALADGRRQFEVNLMGAARLTQLVLPALRARRAGRIVNVSSMGGRIYFPLGAWYHASKHALEGWSDCLRVEVAPFGIEVVVVQPGLIRTEFGDRMDGPMMERSGRGPYAALARAMHRGVKDSYERAGAGSPPELVARTITRAIEDRRPRTRYVVGKLAGTLLFLRRWLGDRLYDRLLRSQVRGDGVAAGDREDVPRP